MSKKSVKFALMSNSHQLILLDGSAFLFRAYFSTIAQNLTNDEGFPRKIVLDKVSFELQQGEFLTIIGPNGAGKSSLIKVLLGLIKADSGNIKRAKKLKLGYMPQAFSPNPFMPLKVLDFCNLNQSVASSFLQETAELTGIKNLLNSPLKTLSGGELQRVLLTRALL
jgi:zinc transport system ATP-binding protein